MLTTEIISVFPCTNCAHKGICKYESEVMSFCRSNPLPSLECLMTSYSCKYHSPIYSTSLLSEYGTVTNRTANTGTSYTLTTTSEC